MANSVVSFPQSPALRPSRGERYQLEHVSDEALHAGVKALAGRYNVLTAELLAHLAEVDARGIYRERACSSLYTYCVYELRLSEDEAQRRAKAARTTREFPVLFEMLAEGAIHLTGLLLLAPCLTLENHAELLARSRFRTKREIEHLVAQIAPRPDVPARIEPLGPRPAAVRNLWQAYTASLRGPVRELVPGLKAGQAPPAVVDGTPDEAAESGVDSCEDARDDDLANPPAPARKAVTPAGLEPKPLGLLRYRVEFTASERYVELLEEARELLQHQVPDRDVARVHELAMEVFVEHLRKRRQAATERPRRAVASDGSAPARVVRAGKGSAPAWMKARRGAASDTGPRDAWEPGGANGRHVPAAVRRAVWRHDERRCTFADANGRRCQERAGLEIHHEHAFALGGPATLENLRLLCRAHNALHAERDFGRAHVEHMKKRGAADVPAQKRHSPPAPIIGPA